MVACPFCEDKKVRTHFPDVVALKDHVKHEHDAQELNCSPFYRFETAFQNYAARYMLALADNDAEAFDVSTLFETHRAAMEDILNHFGLPLRFFVTLRADLTKIQDDDELAVFNHYLNSHVRTVWTLDEARRALERACEELSVRLENHQESASGLALAGIHACEIHVGRLRPSQVGCAGVDLPEELRKKRCILNVRDGLRDDEKDKCFMFSVLAGLHPAAGYKRLRASSYRDKAPLYKWNVSFPVSFPRDVKIFEEDNDVSVNVFGYDLEGKFVYPLKIVNEEKPKKHVDLLLINDHFVLISDFSKLFPGHRSLRKRCKRCMQGFQKQSTLEKHLSYCRDKKPARITYPKPGEKLKFDSPYQTEQFPFFGVFDFEAILESGKERRHVPSSCCLLIVRTSDGKIVDEFLYRGPDCVQQFIQKLNKVAITLPEEVRALNHPITMTSSDTEQHESATHCALCKESFAKKIKVRDHDHATGAFRASLCQKCNLLRSKRASLPLICHNLSYDISFILPFAHLFTCGKIEMLGRSCQKFKKVQIGPLQMIDSLAFLNASLNTLVQDLKSKGTEFFGCLRSQYPQDYPLLLGKNPMCYDYLDNFSRYDEPELPARESFYNRLHDEHLSEEDYAHAQRVFSTFKCKTLGDYSDLYMKVDCLLLSDVMVNFRQYTYKKYRLDPLHFVSLPSLGWACALKESGISLELLSDPNHYLFFEKGLRGGVCQASARHVETNDPESSNFDPEQEISRILSFDANGLYAFCMQKPLPCANFRFLSEKEVSSFDLDLAVQDTQQGFVLEVDLEYPPELHPSHSSFPLAPEKRVVSYELLSPYQKQLVELFGLPRDASETKLLLTLLDKEKYICYHENLKLYVDLGMKVKKIHQIMAFSQKPFLRGFIEQNHTIRQQATNAFQKNLSKFFMNSVYGKTLQNPRHFTELRLCTSKEQFSKAFQKPNLLQFRILSEDVALCESAYTSFRLKQPLYLGFVILELSKLHMYRMFYHKVRPALPDASVVYTDTDSLYLHLKGPDIDSKLASISSDLDTSSYPSDHRLFSTQNQMRLGAFKNEIPNDTILGFVALKPKLYSLKLKSETAYNRAKGVKKCATRKLTYELYVSCLQTSSRHSVLQDSIVRKNNANFSVTSHKIALNPFSNKRFILDDAITSFPFGYKPPECTKCKSCKYCIEHWN